MLYQRVNQCGNSFVSPLTSMQIFPSFSGSQDTLYAVVAPTRLAQRRQRRALLQLANGIRHHVHFESGRLESAQRAGRAPGSAVGHAAGSRSARPRPGQSGEAYFQEMGYFTATGTYGDRHFDQLRQRPGRRRLRLDAADRRQRRRGRRLPRRSRLAHHRRRQPGMPVGQEPLPNGGRINLGSDGGTAQATPSPPQLLQVLSPDPGSSAARPADNITWQTGGLYAPAGYYANAVLADHPLAYYPLNDTSGTAATDSSGNGLNATYVGGVQLGLPGACRSIPAPP